MTTLSNSEKTLSVYQIYNKHQKYLFSLKNHILQLDVISFYHFWIIRNTLRNEDLNSMDLQYTYKILFNDISFWNHI